MRDEVIEWRNEKNLAREKGEQVKLRATLLDELIGKELLTGEERVEVEQHNQVKIASQTIVIEPDDPESLDPDLTIEKRIISTPTNGKTYMVWEDVWYEIKIKNEGTETAKNILITDVLTIKRADGSTQEIKNTFKELEDVDGNKLPSNQLAPQQEGYVRYKYTIQPEDLGAELTNKATVKTKRPIPDGIKTPVDEKTGMITLIKQAGLPENDTQNLSKKDWNFHITLKKDGVKINKTVYYTKDSNPTKVAITNGEGTFQLKHGESINIIGIPDGTTYRIWEDETGYNEDYTYRVSTGYVDNEQNYSEGEWWESTINLKQKEIETITCSNEIAQEYGRLNITKILQNYNETLGTTSFIFKIEAKEKDGTIVYSDYENMTFTKIGSNTITVDNIPAGTTVTVTEVYSGASYEIVGSSVATCVIVSDAAVKEGAGEAASVSFVNEYNGGNRGGYAINNHFESDGNGGWTVENPTKTP